MFAGYIKCQILSSSLFLRFAKVYWTSCYYKNLPHGFYKSADVLSKRQKHEEDVFKLCVLLKKSELYHSIYFEAELLT